MMDLSAYCRPVGASSSIPRSGGGGGGGGNESYNSNKKRDATYNGNNSGGGGVSGHQDANDENPASSSNNKAELKRRCIDYHTPAVLDLTSRLYRKPNRRMHSIPGGSGSAGYPFLQCHT
eukprot:CAMPEP_0196132632 /NCGR_PEP_ID=MMETSP0910-20130528/2169_1 /TAXON_ID=49265 /ORGANISM="Thalassiosira rotula, Strain GSO102" /LENGTH=119 /DNA_ID=CAMNT_0041392253 /DNA_START=47 /DNA_END=402 /DNA_ORIENTATION=-